MDLPKKADVNAIHISNGMGERHDDGPYVTVAIRVGDHVTHYQISQGTGENLAAELMALTQKMELRKVRRRSAARAA